MEDVGTFYDIWSIFGHQENVIPFGIFCANLVCFSRFGTLCQEKSGNPA
jgi:hypothetical protein